MKWFITGVLASWFVLVLVLGASGAFIRAPGTPPIPILIGATLGLVVFIAAYLGWRAFREAILNADVALLAALQAWRAGGLGFLALSANGVLPSSFTWPAGWGDIAIGVTAPWVALALVRRPNFAGSRLFVIWNVLGILDLVVAVTMGALSSGLVPSLSGDVTTGPVSHFPLVLVPAYLVPLFVMFHLTALLQARRQARSTASRERTDTSSRTVTVGSA